MKALNYFWDILFDIFRPQTEALESHTTGEKGLVYLIFKG